MTLCYFADVDTISANDCILHAAPLSHGSGMYNFPHVAAAATQVLPESGHFDPAEILALSRRWQGMALFAAPTMVRRLVAHARERSPNLDGLKTIVYGGAPMYLEDIREALRVMGPRFAQIYGQGESPMTITGLSKAMHADIEHPLYETRLATAGVARTGVSFKIVSDNGGALPPGEVGEIITTSDCVMKGYWNNPEANVQALRDGWLWTGDLGSVDACGFLTIKDRSKDMIITGGSNVYPREIEEVLLTHAGVLECAVASRPHADWGEEVVAFVVRRPDVQVSATDLDRLCLDNIARFKRPKSYRFVDRLPKNNYGKVLKNELRELLRAEPSTSVGRN